MKRKRLYLLAVLILAFSMLTTACGGGSQSASSNNSLNSPANETKEQDKKDVKRLSQGVTDTEIKIGNWVAKSGPAASYAVVAEGAQSYFNKVNAEGGINGRKIKFVSLDDQYQPSRTVAVAKKLVEEEKVFALVATLGSSQNKAVKPYIEKIRIPILVDTGASQFVNPPIKNYFGLITTYGIEAHIFVQYAAETMGAKKVGIFYQNDDFGKDGFKVAKEDLQKRGIEIVAEVPYNATDVDFSSAAIKMKEAAPDVILGFSIPKSSAAFWKEYKKLGGDKQLVVSYVTGSDTNMFNLAGPAWEGVISSNFIPSVDDKSDPKIKEFLDQFTKDYPNSPATSLAQYGWTYAQIATEAMKKCGDELTWENFIKQMESLKDWNGSMAYDVTYTENSRYGQTSSFMIQAKNGKLEKISEVIKYEP